MKASARDASIPQYFEKNFRIKKTSLHRSSFRHCYYTIKKVPVREVYETYSVFDETYSFSYFVFILQPCFFTNTEPPPHQNRHHYGGVDRFHHIFQLPILYFSIHIHVILYLLLLLRFRHFHSVPFLDRCFLQQ